MNTTRKTLSRNYAKDWKTFVLRYGKYRGQTLLWVAENKPDYLIYLAANASNEEAWQAKLDAAVDHMLEQGPTP
jgi:hypothetical protein